MTDNLELYIYFINSMNNDYKDTINDTGYDKFIADMVKQEFANNVENNIEKPINKNIVNNTNAEIKPINKNIVNNTNVKIQPINKNIEKNIVNNTNVKIQPINKNISEKSQDYPEINTKYSSHKNMNLLRGGMSEEMLVNFIDSIDNIMRNDQYKINVNVNNYDDEENKIIYNRIIQIIKNKFINPILENFVNVYKLSSGLDDLYLLDDITNQTADEINRRFSIIKLNSVEYFEIKIPICILFMYLTTRYLSNDKNFNSIEYKQNLYLFFIFIFQFRDYFDVILRRSDTPNNLNIIPKKINKIHSYDFQINGMCDILSGRKMINDISDDAIEQFENRELKKIFDNKRIIGLDVNINSVNFSELLLNILFQFMFHRYTIWLAIYQPFYYDRYYNCIFFKTPSSDGKYSVKDIVDSNFENDGRDLTKCIHLFKNSSLKNNKDVIAFSSTEFITCYYSIFYGCYLDIMYENDSDGHRIGIIYDTSECNFKIYDPNYLNYSTNSVCYYFINNHEKTTEFVFEISTSGEFYKKCCIMRGNEAEKIVITPFYGNLVNNSNYFMEIGVSFNIYYLSPSIPNDVQNIETNVNFYNYEVPKKIIDNINPFINGKQYYFYDYMNKIFYNYAQKDTSVKSETRYNEITYTLSKFEKNYNEMFAFKYNSESIIIKDIYSDVDYIKISHRDFLRIEDVVNKANNFYIYYIAPEDQKFNVFWTNQLMGCTKLGINPFLKNLNFELKKREDFPLAEEKMTGGIDKTKTLILSIPFIIMFIIIIGIIIYIVLKYFKSSNTNDDTNNT